MPFVIEKQQLNALSATVSDVHTNAVVAMGECPGGRCGNNCSGTCAWSPCTNLCAATSH